MQRCTKSNQKSASKVISAIIAAIVICALAVVPAFADAFVEPNVPAFTLTATVYPNGLMLSDCMQLENCLRAQLALTTINNAYVRPPLMAIYQIQVSGGYQYHAVVLASNRAGNANYTISYTSNDDISTLTLAGTGSWNHYVWVDDNNTGWAYAGASTATVTTSGVIYYQTSSTSSGSSFTPNTQHLGTDSLTGNACARYLAAYEAFNTMSSSGGGGGDYTEAQYLQYGQQQYNLGKQDGISVGRQDVISDPGGYNLFTYAEYSGNYTAGQQYVIRHPAQFNLYTKAQYDDAYQDGYDEGSSTGIQRVKIDIGEVFESVLTAPQTIIHNIVLPDDIQHANLTNVLGINVAGIFVTLIIGAIVTLVVVLIKKLG